MPIIGITLNGINAKKHEEITSSVKINSNMNITSVKEQDLPALNTKGLSIDFTFLIKYQDKNDKDKAEIGMEGSIIFMGEEKEDILKTWKKEKKLPDQIKYNVIRLVSEKCSKKGIMISDDLQLPPPPLLITAQNPEDIPKEFQKQKSG